MRFQSLSTHDETTSQFDRQQINSGSQIPLPVIAPRPSTQEDQAAMQTMNAMISQGLPGGPYGFSGFPSDGQPYSSNDLRPRMRQQIVYQGSSFDSGLITPQTETPVGNVAQSPSYPLFQPHQSAGESDSVINMFQSDWSQSLPSSTTVPIGFPNGPTHGVSPTVAASPAQYWNDPTVQALLAAQADQAPQSTWPAAAQNRPYDESTAFLPSQASHGYQRRDEALHSFGPANTTTRGNLHPYGLKGNGKHQAVLPM